MAFLRLESSKNEAFEKASFLLNKTKLFAQAKALFLDDSNLCTLLCTNDMVFSISADTDNHQ